MIGHVIGNYRVVAELGKGGMGVVYRAEHVQLGRAAALKMLLPQFSTDEKIVQRFFNEARAASSIAHPGIVEIYDFGKHSDGRAFIVMALLEGESLQERMARAPLVPEEGATVVAQVASALAAAHARGIVHRDLKPDNIYLVPNELMPSGIGVKLLDFGIAKLADDRASFKTQTGSLIGTPAYMSPEQCMGRSDVDHRTDLYALGCILHHVLTGRPPFVSTEGAGPLIAAHLRDPAPDPRGFNPRVSPALAQITRRLLQKDPAARYQSANELRDALMRAGASVSATRPAQPAPTTASGSAAQIVPPPPAKPGRAGLWIALVLVLAVAGAIAVVATKQRAATPPPPTATAAACPAGQRRSDDTQGHCCWPDQAWSSAKQGCVGAPRCPAGLVPAPEGCAPAPALTFVLDQQQYAPGARVTMQFSTPPSPARAWVTIVEPARPDDAYGTWAFVDDKARTASLLAPTEPGTYEARLHTDYPAKLTNLHARVKLEVRALAEAEPADATPRALQTFTLVEPAALRGGTLELRFPAPMHAVKGERFWITVVPARAADDAYNAYDYVADGARTATLRAPSTAGAYEVRLHANYPTRITNVVHRVSVAIR